MAENNTKNFILFSLENLKILMKVHIIPISTFNLLHPKKGDVITFSRGAHSPSLTLEKNVVLSFKRK